MKGCVSSQCECFLCLLQYILNDTEVQVKTELWMKQNAEYLKEQKGQKLFIIIIIITSNRRGSRNTREEMMSLLPLYLFYFLSGNFCSSKVL